MTDVELWTEGMLARVKEDDDVVNAGVVDESSAAKKVLVVVFATERGQVWAKTSFVPDPRTRPRSVGKALLERAKFKRDWLLKQRKEAT